MESSRKHTNTHALCTSLLASPFWYWEFCGYLFIVRPTLFFTEWMSVYACLALPCRMLYLCMTTKCWRHINLNLPKTGIKLTKNIWTEWEKYKSNACTSNGEQQETIYWDERCGTDDRSFVDLSEMQSRKHFSSPQIDHHHHHDDDRWWAFVRRRWFSWRCWCCLLACFLSNRNLRLLVI